MKAVTYRVTNPDVLKFLRENAPAKTELDFWVMVDDKATSFETACCKVVNGRLINCSPLDKEAVIPNEKPGDSLSVYSKLNPGPGIGLMPWRAAIQRASEKFHN